jgi:hypothetical protein
LGNLLATYAVLLVSEGESSSGDCLDIHVIQRRVRGGVKFIADVEGDVAEAESLGAAFLVAVVGVFGRAEEPVESNDAEIDDVLVGVAINRVLGVKFFDHTADDRDVGWVGALDRVVRASESVEESRE